MCSDAFASFLFQIFISILSPLLNWAHVGGVWVVPSVGHPTLFFFFNVYFSFWQRRRWRQSMSGGGAKREGDAESEAGSRLWAVSTEPDTGLELTDCEIMTWAEVGRSTDWATQAPLQLLISAQVVISQFVTWSPMSGFALTAWNLLGMLSLSVFLSVSLSLFPSPAHARSLNIKNKH